MTTPDLDRELAAIDAALQGRPVDDDLLELGALALAVRDERPEPEPQFSSMLDAKVARGFAAPSGKRTFRRRLAFNLGIPKVPLPALGGVLALAIAAVIGVSLTGAKKDNTIHDFAAAPTTSTTASTANQGTFGSDTETTGGDAAGGGSAASSTADSATPERDAAPLPAAKSKSSAQSSELTPAPDDLEKKPRTASSSASTAGSAASSSSSDPSFAGATSSTPFAQPAKPGRKVERSAELTIATPNKNVDSVSNGVVRVTDRFNGVVLDSQVQTTDASGTGEFTLRFPVSKLDGAIAELSKLGDVRSRTQNAQDITSTFQSARTRLEEAQAERKSLLKQLAKATTENETSSLRSRLRNNGAEIDSYQASLDRVNNRANYATVQLTVQGDDTAVAVKKKSDDGAWGPGDAWHDAKRVLAVIAGGALVGLAAGIPAFLMLGLLFWAARVSVRRRREAALDA